jgi:hypothetical protein
VHSPFCSGFRNTCYLVSICAASDTLPAARKSAVGERGLAMRVIERIGGYYEAQEVPLGVAYRWYPGYVLIECGCGEMLSLTCFMSTCSECAADHTAVVREELAGQCSEDEVLHPWRYAGDREGLGLPF